MEFGSFPKNLAYNVKSLSGFSKTVVKLTPTPNGAVEAGNTFKVRLPPNTLVDLRTLSMFYEGTCTSTTSGATTGGWLRFPRLSSSIIDTLNIYVNGTLIENIQAYGDLYNCLYDISAAGDQTAKRYLENSDPSIYIDNTVSATYDDGRCGKVVKATAFANATGGSAAHATKQVFCINNWLGFLGSSSTPVIDTNDTGVIEIEIRLKPATILWATNGDAIGADPTVAGANYKIDNISFNVNKIVFNDPLYYNLKASKLLGDGLTIGYQTYICSKSGAQNKSTSMNINTNINTTSLDQLILTSAPAVPTVQNLLLYNAGASDISQLSFNQAKAGLNVSVATANTYTNGLVIGAANTTGSALGGTFTVASTNTLTYTPHVNTTSVSTTAGATFGMMIANAPDVGDLFNQSQAFRRDLVGLATSSVEINNIPLTPQPLKPWEMFNETLIALGNHNLDLSAGVHEGCFSLPHFLKYYGTHIVSLENIQTDGFYKSGLDGKSSALNIVWKPTFDTNATNQIIPVIYAKTTRMLVISEGHNITCVV